MGITRVQLSRKDDVLIIRNELGTVQPAKSCAKVQVMRLYKYCKCIMVLSLQRTLDQHEFMTHEMLQPGEFYKLLQNYDNYKN